MIFFYLICLLIFLNLVGILPYNRSREQATIQGIIWSYAKTVNIWSTISRWWQNLEKSPRDYVLEDILLLESEKIAHVHNKVDFAFISDTNSYRRRFSAKPMYDWTYKQLESYRETLVWLEKK